MSDVKAQLAALAARQSGGKTNDPAALTGPSSINAKVPAIPDPEGTKKGKSAAGKAGGKGKAKASTKQKMRQEKAKERAEALGGLMEKKLKEKEGRKLAELRESEARSVFAPQTTNPEDTSEAAVRRTRFIAFTERESAKRSVVLSTDCLLSSSLQGECGGRFRAWI
ncbi:hypothetical protein QFC19_005147 [Naganishia cerealis]|uniref:Uncharacterized protein n=1 Tax=Naganishia cerealis TaxID=610337 RepID=A0ACC2VQU4_9TREE|nr:hypothetical protein QFC19_005147 [Naganishia cerealis]